jgi:hypothetical protein
MIAMIEQVAKELALAVLDIIEWAWRRVTAPEG